MSKIVIGGADEEKKAGWFRRAISQVRSNRQSDRLHAMNTQRHESSSLRQIEERINDPNRVKRMNDLVNKGFYMDDQGRKVTQAMVYSQQKKKYT